MYSSHLYLRDPELANTLFKNRRGSGGSERNEPPRKMSIPKLALEAHSDVKCPPPKMDSLTENQHPQTMDTDKYFFGDRFHDKNFPHKSELCRHHDINLIRELKTVPTSGQENLNSIRNRLRLRSTCTQKLSTHLLYNGVVMDRAHNRDVVMKQAETMEKNVYLRDPEWKHAL